MHGDSLLMLTTKVVSNKKPPLLSDSESGGSTSPHIALMGVLNKTVYKFIDIIFPFNIVLIILIEVIGISFMVKLCGKKVCKYLGLI